MENEGVCEACVGRVAQCGARHPATGCRRSLCDLAGVHKGFQRVFWDRVWNPFAQVTSCNEFGLIPLWRGCMLPSVPPRFAKKGV